MTVAILAGIGFGAALLGALAGARSIRPNPAALLRTAREAVSDRNINRSEQRATTPRASVGNAHRVLGSRMADVIEHRGVVPPRIAEWLAITETSLGHLCTEVVVAGLVGFILPFSAMAVATVLHLRLPVVVPVWVAIALLVAGVVLPIASLRNEAEAQRGHARQVLASLLDLVSLALAGGMGLEGALFAACGVAENRVSHRLMRELELARDAGEPPWTALARLGTRLGVEELVELSAAVNLAGIEGARIRRTLSAKAASIRRHELASAESAANTLTERLFLPGALLLVGFLLFVGYPAVARIATGF